MNAHQRRRERRKWERFSGRLAACGPAAQCAADGLRGVARAIGRLETAFRAIMRRYSRLGVLAYALPYPLVVWIATHRRGAAGAARN